MSNLDLEILHKLKRKVIHQYVFEKSGKAKKSAEERGRRASLRLGKRTKYVLEDINVWAMWKSGKNVKEDTCKRLAVVLLSQNRKKHQRVD